MNQSQLKNLKFEEAVESLIGKDYLLVRENNLLTKFRGVSTIHSTIGDIEEVIGILRKHLSTTPRSEVGFTVAK